MVRSVPCNGFSGFGLRGGRRRRSRRRRAVRRNVKVVNDKEFVDPVPSLWLTLNPIAVAVHQMFVVAMQLGGIYNKKNLDQEKQGL